MSNVRGNIATLVSELREALEEAWRLQFDEEAELELGEPTTPLARARLAERLGQPLPPSYAAFLELHDGWRDFKGDLSILAVGDYDVSWVKERLEEWGGLFEESTGENPYATWAFPILLGETSGRSIAFDRRRCTEGGELEVVAFDYTQEERRFPSFADFLRHELGVTRQVIESELQGPAEE